MAEIIPYGQREGVVSQADTDAQLLALWLHGRPPSTRRAYERDADRFLAFVAKPVRHVKLGDVQAFADSLDGLAPATRGRSIAVVKSLLSFAHRIGYVPFNVAGPVRVPNNKDARSERILAEGAVQKMLALEPNNRNRVLLRLLYAGGFRVAEISGLRRRDLSKREDGGQIVVFGKGGKTRTVLLPESVWQDLQSLDVGDGPDAPVFRSRKGSPLSVSQVWRIVRNAARRAGIEIAVSPHFLRHAHASHALDRGAPIHLVQATLGHASVATTGRYLHARPKDSSSRYLAL